MTYTDGITDTFPTGSPELPPYRLVKLSTGKLVLNTATATDRPIGATRDLSEAGDPACIKYLTSPGTIEMEAAGVISSGADVFSAADGKIQALPATTGTYRRIGTALEAASAAGAVIEVLPDDFNSTKTVA